MTAYTYNRIGPLVVALLALLGVVEISAVAYAAWRILQ